MQQATTSNNYEMLSAELKERKTVISEEVIYIVMNSILLPFQKVR